MTHDIPRGPPEADDASGRPGPLGEGRRILLAEDALENRLLVKAFLGRTPHRLEEVVNGRDAVERVTSGGVFDLVLMDVEMPEMNGYEATRAIRAWERESSRARLPIVALTAHGEPEERERSAEAGCDAHVLKPIRKALLLETIATYALAPRGGGAASEGPP